MPDSRTLPRASPDRSRRLQRSGNPDCAGSSATLQRPRLWILFEGCASYHNISAQRVHRGARVPASVESEFRAPGQRPTAAPGIDLTFDLSDSSDLSVGVVLLGRQKALPMALIVQYVSALMTKRVDLLPLLPPGVDVDRARKPDRLVLMWAEIHVPAFRFGPRAQCLESFGVGHGSTFGTTHWPSAENS